MAGRLERQDRDRHGTRHRHRLGHSAALRRRGREGLAVDIKEPGEKLAAALKQHPDALRFGKLDVRSEEGWADGLAACVKAFGQPNVLINNAG